MSASESLDEWYWKVWSHGRYLDLWSVPHTLFGMITACLGLGLGWDVLLVYLLTFSAALIWELGELWRDIWEPWQNRVMDVVTTVLGFILIHVSKGFLESRYLHAAGLMAVTWMFFNSWGWAAWLKRSKS